MFAITLLESIHKNGGKAYSYEIQNAHPNQFKEVIETLEYLTEIRALISSKEHSDRLYTITKSFVDHKQIYQWLIDNGYR